MATDLASGIRQILPARVRPLAARAARAALRWGAFPGSIVRAVWDRLDERRARRRRARLGRRLWLVSWQRGDGGGWWARLSSPSLLYTLERTGRTRSQAIDRAVRALTRILDLQQQRAAAARPTASDPDELDYDPTRSF